MRSWKDRIYLLDWYLSVSLCLTPLFLLSLFSPSPPLCILEWKKKKGRQTVSTTVYVVYVAGVQMREGQGYSQPSSKV